MLKNEYGRERQREIMYNTTFTPRRMHISQDSKMDCMFLTQYGEKSEITS